MPAPVTLELIAKEAGVSVSTVSRALQNHHWVSPATKLRIQQIAQRLGYTPDARLSELMGHLRSRKVKSDQPALAVLTTFPGMPDQQFKSGRNPIAGILKQAKALGYRIEVFATQEPGMTTRRLSSIIWNRGIKGVIVYPLESPGSITGFRWELFSPVVIGYSLREPALHRVVIDYHQSTHLCLSRALESGSRKIGLVLPEGIDQRTNHLYRSAYLGFQNLAGKEKVGPMLVCDFRDREPFRIWLKENRFDSVVTPGDISLKRLAGWLEELRLPGKPPRLLNLSLASPTGSGAGVYQDTMETGMEAVRYVVQLIHSRETGVPQRPRLISIAGVWTAGTTSSPCAPAVPAARG